ncbi:MAG: VOC family protein [Halioglobus sp.]
MPTTSLPRLRQLVIASDTLNTADQLRQLLALGEPFADPGVAEFGLDNAVFAIGDQFLEIVVPHTPTAPAQRFLDRQGPGGYMAIFEIDDIQHSRASCDSAGFRRVWNIDLEDIAASHLHPADVGAAIVSIDETRPTGSWRWGGPNWHKQSRPGALTGAIVESPEPTSIASRWSSVLGQPSAGQCINLASSTLKFAKGAQDRLIGFEIGIAAPDSVERVLARAKALGLKCEGDSVTLAGVQLLLKPLAVVND